MRGVRSLSSGLFIGLVVAATVLGGLVLSVRGQPTSINELPIPTVTLQIAFASPAPLNTPAVRASLQPVSPQPSALSPQTPTPTATVCPISPFWQRYSVGPFDTLSSIAQRFNLAPDQLVQANCLGQPVVTVGQTLYVPGLKPTPSASVPCYPPYNWYRAVVQPGDTLSSIAARYGTSVYTLMRANCLSTTYIYAGQVLAVPPTVPVVYFTPTPIIPIFTPTPPFGSLTPTVIPTTPAITVTPGPADTPGPTDTPGPADTPGPTTTAPAPSGTPGPTSTSAPADTPAPTVAPTEPLPSTTAPAPTLPAPTLPAATSPAATSPAPTTSAPTEPSPPANTPAPLATSAPPATPAPPQANTAVPPATTLP
jgi:LysM repeat protein